jgi:hypothetical protein
MRLGGYQEPMMGDIFHAQIYCFLGIISLLGFVLALIISPHNLTGLPSYSVDWTVLWLNYKAGSLKDFPTVSRPVDEEYNECRFD